MPSNPLYIKPYQYCYRAQKVRDSIEGLTSRGVTLGLLASSQAMTIAELLVEHEVGTAVVGKYIVAGITPFTRLHKRASRKSSRKVRLRCDMPE